MTLGAHGGPIVQFFHHARAHSLGHKSKRVANKVRLRRAVLVARNFKLVAERTEWIVCIAPLCKLKRGLEVRSRQFKNGCWKRVCH